MRARLVAQSNTPAATLATTFRPPSTPRRVLLWLCAVNVTIPRGERSGFGLHQNADYFAFIYPIDRLAETLRAEQMEKLQRSTIPALLLSGGFMYVNEHGTIQDVRAIMHDGPTEMSWSSACNLGDEPQRELRQQKRFSRVTFPETRKTGALSFAWINPGASLSLCSRPSRRIAKRVAGPSPCLIH